jgi:hypothetical protein
VNVIYENVLMVKVVLIVHTIKQRDCLEVEVYKSLLLLYMTFYYALNNDGNKRRVK